MTPALVILAAAFVFGSGFFSGCETGIYCLNRIWLRLAGHRGDPRAIVLRRLLHDEQGLISGVLIGTNLCNYLASVAVARIVLGYAVPAGTAEVYTAAILTPIMFVFGEVVPKNLFRRHANRWTLRSVRPLRIAMRLFRGVGLVGGLQWLSDRMMRLTGDRSGTGVGELGGRAEIQAMLEEGWASGALTDEQSRMIQRVMNLADVAVRDVMVPVARAVTVDRAQSRTAFLTSVRRHPHSRVPVTQNGRPVGIVNVYDVLSHPAPDRPASADPDWLMKLARPPLWFDTDQPVTAALYALQRARRVMACVRDRQGRWVGILTLKDLVEEIIGEIGEW